MSSEANGGRVNIKDLQHRGQNAVRLRLRNAKLRGLRASLLTARPEAVPYAPLDEHSLALAGVNLQAAPRTDVVNVLLPELLVGRVFAGIRTALEFSVGLAEELGASVRLIPFDNSLGTADRAEFADYVRTEFKTKIRVEFVNLEDAHTAPFSTRDLWVATHWKTAHALDVACSVAGIERRRCVYLIQDYEPSFFSWSQPYAVARSTYAAGFMSVVNSTPLFEYLRVNEPNCPVADELVFAPQLDVARAATARAGRRLEGRRRVLFYGRPAKPRNLFDIGTAAIRLASAQLEEHGLPTDFFSMGETVPPVRLGGGAVMACLGKMSWDEYFSELGRADVVLSLQLSPHPSHPPLDTVLAGGIAVTNDVGGTRAHLHERLIVAEPNPRDIAARLVETVTASRSSPLATDLPSDLLAKLGRPLRDVIDESARRLRGLQEFRALQD